MVQLNVYKNTDSTSAQYGKAYARADYKQTLSVSDLAKLLAVATGNYTKEELNKDATLGWTKAAQEKIDADKAAMNQPEP